MNHIDEQPQTVSQRIKHVFFDILEKSTFHGLPKIFLSKYIVFNAFWSGLCLVSYTFCAYLVTNRILDFCKYEVVTRYEEIYENQPPFPYVLFRGHDSTKTKCTFNKEPCPDTHKYPDGAFELFNGLINESCIKNERVPILKSEQYGHGSGLQLKLYANDLGVESGIAVHISNHSSDIVNDPRFISAGMRTTFVLKRVFNERLPQPYSNCRSRVTGSEQLDQLNRVYYRNVCFNYCFYYLVAKSCNLFNEFLGFSYLYYTDDYELFTDTFLSFMYGNCNHYLINETYSNYTQNVFESCQNVCPIECNTFSFSISAFCFKLSNTYPENYAELNIFYENFDYTLISQTPKVTSDVVLGTLGGLVGLFLGASLLSFDEFIELFIRVVHVLTNTSKKQRNKTTDDAIKIGNNKSTSTKNSKRTKPPLAKKMKQIGLYKSSKRILKNTLK